MTASGLSSFQRQLRDQVLSFLQQAGVSGVKTKEKVTCLDEEEPDQLEHSVVVKFVLDGKRCELWIYEDEAGISEPGDEWWSFDRDDFQDGGELTDAVMAHLADLLAEHRGT